MHPSLVIFDCDGTLVDTEAICNEALHALICSLGWNISLDHSAQLFTGLSTMAAAEIIAREVVDHTPTTIAELIESEEIEVVSIGAKLMPGVSDAINLLVQKGIKYCVATNASLEKAQTSLTCAGVIHHFQDHIFASPMVENPKPAPDIFLYAAKQMGEPTDATWVIEDSSTGMRAGVAAGMRTFGLQHHVNKEQIVQIGAEPIDSLGEFIQILSSAL